MATKESFTLFTFVFVGAVCKHSNASYRRRQITFMDLPIIIRLWMKTEMDGVPKDIDRNRSGAEVGRDC